MVENEVKIQEMKVLRTMLKEINQGVPSPVGYHI